MFWKDCLQLLVSSPITVLQQSSNQDFLDVEMIESYSEDLPCDKLFMASLSALSESLSKYKYRSEAKHSIILLKDSDIPDNLKDIFQNIDFLRSSDQFLNVYEILKKGIAGSHLINNQLQVLMDIISTEDDLYKVTDWLCDFFGHPINIVDNNFTYLAHSDSKGFAEFGSKELMKDIRNGYVSPDHIKKIQETQGYDLFRTASLQPVLVYSPNEGFHQYHTPIPIGNTIAGAFSVYLHLDEDLDPLARLYLKRISRLISVILQRTNFYSNNKASFYNSFFTSMLQGVPDKSKNWEERLSSYGYRVLPSLHIIAAAFPSVLNSRTEIDNIALTLRSIFPNSIYFISEYYIYFLCSNAAGIFDTDKLFTKGDDVYTRNNLRIGISSEFDSIYDMALHVAEARTAIELGTQLDPRKRFFLYDNMRIFDIVQRLAEQRDISSLCYPPFMKVFDYDLAHGSQLGPTLYHYLCNIKDPAVACRKLNIHKNTLYFRLDKIRSVMNVDYTKLSVASQIFLTIVILRYTNNLTDSDLDFTTSYLDGTEVAFRA